MVVPFMAAAATLGDGCIVPPNEMCDGAIVFTSSDLPFTDSGLIGCENDVADKPYYDIFYRYDCTIGGPHVLDMCGSDGDTYLRIYVDGCGWSDGSELAVADDECPSSPPNADPLLAIDLEAGTTYWIELGTWRPDPPWGAPNLPFVFNVVVEPEPCPADTDGDGAVGVDDLLGLLGAWGTNDPLYDLAPPGGDGVVDVDDLLILLGAWGPCP
jgi:hypothetical protein